MAPLRPIALLLAAGLVADGAVAPESHRPEASLSDGYLAQAAVEQWPGATPTSLVAW